MIATGTCDEPDDSGYSLRERLDECRRNGLPGLPISELLRCVEAVANALDTRATPHGDVRPETIRIDAGRVRLTATTVNDQPLAPASGAIRGTPVYLAPEMWEGRRTARSDQYALACTYAELRTGRPVWPASDLPTLVRMHLQGLPDLDGCTDAERQVLLRALAKDAKQRFPDCRQLAAHLAHAVARGAS
jgi:serine/threonine-protein kinase